jgi:hypothetical protein
MVPGTGSKPGRPLGVTLAIISSALLLGIIPLAYIGIITLIRRNIYNNLTGAEGSQPMFLGVDYVGLPDWRIAVQVIMALAFLLVAAFAWRGKPAAMRWILPLGVAVSLFINGLLAFAVQQPAAQAGASSADAFFAAFDTGRIVIGLLTFLYVLWYMNRAPARAFYRGYFLPPPA